MEEGENDHKPHGVQGDQDEVLDDMHGVAPADVNVAGLDDSSAEKSVSQAEARVNVTEDARPGPDLFGAGLAWPQTCEQSVMALNQSQTYQHVSYSDARWQRQSKEVFAYRMSAFA